MPWIRAGVIFAVLMPSGCAGNDSQTPSFDYPVARRVAQVDDYHGVQVEDPYRWLEELDAEETRQWVQSQNDLARPYLEGLTSRQKVSQRLTELWNYERFSLPVTRGGKYFYRHNDGLQDQDILYVTEELGGDRRVLLDPNGFSEDATVALADYSPSPDARYLAYSISDGGSDWKHWKVRDVESGEDLVDEIRFTKFTEASWDRESRGFYYSRYPTGAQGEGDDSATIAVYYHRLGDPQSEDLYVYKVPGDTRRDPYAQVTEDGRYLVLEVRDGFQSNAVYYLPLTSRPAGEPPVVELLNDWDALYTFLGNVGQDFYFHTNREAPRGRIIAVDLAHPEADRWREVVPEAEETLEAASLVGHRLIARYLKDAYSQVQVYDLTGTAQGAVELPGVGSVFGFGGEAGDTETFFSYEDFVTPGTVYRYDLESGEADVVARPEVAMDTSGFEAGQVFFTSRDGTRVPMFLIHRKGLDLDSHNPTLLYGYGGFNISLTPNFNVSRLVWVEMGGVLAIPNLRGGGEYGEGWHLAGTRLDKQNVFDDFIAAAEWLIEHEYTSTPRLAIQGASNGGLLVAAAMTQRPELFGAALPAVGVLDMLRYHLPSANARAWSSDYGLSENEEEFQALLAYSPYHNIKSSVCYPPTLITSADHDDRVVPWHSYKFGARLQAAQGCSNPVLVRIETRAGHGAGKPTWMRIEDLADQLGFVMTALGMGT